MVKLIKDGEFRVDDNASRDFIRRKLGITDTNIKAHHDLPIAGEFHEKFLAAGLDPNDPVFCRAISEATHKLWHSGTNLPPGGYFLAAWRQFFEKKKKATATEILEHLQKIRSGVAVDILYLDGTVKPFIFPP